MNAFKMQTVAFRRLARWGGMATLALSMVQAATAADLVTDVAEGQTRTARLNGDTAAAGDTHVVNIDGTLRGASATSAGSIVLGGSGPGRLTIHNRGRIQGRADFSAQTGGVEFNNYSGPDPMTQGWHFQTGATFGSGDDVLRNHTGGVIAATSGATIAFGGGDDLFDNAGTLVVARDGGGMLTFSGLERFQNAGTIILGSDFSTAESPVPAESNRRMNDILAMPGIDYVGLPGSRIVMDVIFHGGFAQNSCVAYGTDQVADCVDISGGSTSGVTQLLIRNGTYLLGRDGQVKDGVYDNGAGYTPEGFALVVVTGGTSHAGDFILDPESEGYDAGQAFGGGLRRGSFSYSLLYDEDTQTHRLVGLPNRDLRALWVLPALSPELWRLGAAGSYARQGELRRAGAQAQGGVWFKANAQRNERERLSHSLSVYGMTDTVDASYEQDGSTVSLGVDIAGGDADQGYALGISVGALGSEVSFGGLPATLDFSGVAINVYASYRLRDFFVDFGVGGHSAKLDARLADSIRGGQLRAFGARAETGWRFALGEHFSVEPLLSVAYVLPDVNDIKLTGAFDNMMRFDSGKSLRTGLGARLAYDTVLAGTRASFSVTARGWNESKGETETRIETKFEGLDFSDDLSGSYTEVTAGVDLGGEGAWSGFAQAGGMSGSDYQSHHVMMGVRYSW